MKKITAFLFLLSYFAIPAFAQPTNDAGLWSTVNIDKKINKKVSVFLTGEYRVRENFSRTNLFYSELGLEFRPAKFFKTSLSYRTIEKFTDDNTFSYRHRLSLNIILKHKFDRISLSYRQRLQTEVRNVYSSDNGNIPEWYYRHKFDLKYDLNKPITPYIAAEFRYQINNPRAVQINGLWHRGRYIAGLDYKRNDKHSFGLYYLIQREFNISSPQNIYIIGLEYNVSL